MNEIETWEDEEVAGLAIDYKWKREKTILGVRDSVGGIPGMGPPLEPDEEIGYFEVVTVLLYGVEIELPILSIVNKFEDANELVNEISENVTELIEERLGAF